MNRRIFSLFRCFLVLLMASLSLAKDENNIGYASNSRILEKYHKQQESTVTNYGSYYWKMVSSPTSHSEPVCFDRTLAFRNKKNRDCSWVAAKTKKRCNLQWQGKALWEWCPSACGLECTECCEVTAWGCEDNQDEVECNAAFETCTQTC